jgi:hypothetical protein
VNAGLDCNLNGLATLGSCAALSVIGSMSLGTSYSSSSFARIGSSLSAQSLGYRGSLLSVFGDVSLNSVLSVTSTSRCDLDAQVTGLTTVGSVQCWSVIDGTVLGSSFSSTSFTRLGSGICSRD